MKKLKYVKLFENFINESDESLNKMNIENILTQLIWLKSKMSSDGDIVKQLEETHQLLQGWAENVLDTSLYGGEGSDAQSQIKGSKEEVMKSLLSQLNNISKFLSSGKYSDKNVLASIRNTISMIM